MPQKIVVRIIGLLSIAFLAACRSDDVAQPESRGTMYLDSLGQSVFATSSPGTIDNVSYWDGDGVSGSPSIKIKLREQKAYFYKGGQLVGISMISTGREGFETPTGSYKIMQKSPNHRSNLYGEIVDQHGNIINNDADVRKDRPPPGGKFVGAPMPYFMRITSSGVGMHEGYLPGFAASHGCIRMPGQMASTFFQNVSIGTPVSVTY